jgi:mannosyltransferase
VWLVRRVIRGEVVSTDDDDLLLGAGLRVVVEYAFDASKTDLLVQLWER